MLLRHLGRMSRDIVLHAAETRSPWLLVIVATLSVGLVMTAAVKLITPVVLYPFL